ncbi:hypothetical protein [Undibacterium sp. TC9W]|uniref:hypothetical protein n=1 Tax=Undibacterium sp. TC9W TaxID=3413053 RepID=UPI003BF57323
MSAIVLVQLFHLNGATAAPPVSEQALNNRVPLLQASAVIESAKSFLAKERRLDMKKFVLTHLSFIYYSEWMQKRISMANGACLLLRLGVLRQLILTSRFM